MQANSHFAAWMQKPGIIKKLQAFLALSISLNFILFGQILNIKQEILIKEKTKAHSQVLEKPIQEEKITEEELQKYIREYLDRLFHAKEESLEFLSIFTNAKLYTELKTLIDQRQGMGVESNFVLDDIFLESIDQDLAKAIILGQELFPKGEFKARAIELHLIVNTKTKQVLNIPVFKVGQ